MWLLSTDRAELHWFADHSKIPPGGYAILSHTWQGDEQTFQALQALHERCEVTGEVPRALASDKIRECCLLAERDGYRWVWIDSCCINKESSTELSEAINSMFQWYTSAEVCYAYLADVPTDCIPEAPNSAFRTARWHTRGWTLQELLAPSVVVFLSQAWKRLGTKQELSSLLSEITHIREAILLQTLNLSVTCIAERMSWASRRSTTRVEDEAYSLLGLFDINMPTIYGEGQRAFLRLQQEIAKQSIDTSLFAWGVIFLDPGLAVSLNDVWSSGYNPSHHYRFLFAPSPQHFHSPLYYTPELVRPFQPYTHWQRRASGGEGSVRYPNSAFESPQLPSFEMTSYGMRCRFPIIDMGSYCIAVLLCEDRNGHFGLLLHAPPEDELHDPARRRFYTAYTFINPDTGFYTTTRLAYLGGDLQNLTFQNKRVRAEWREVYIQTVSPPRYHEKPTHKLSLFRVQGPPAMPFRIPSWLTSALAALGLNPTWIGFPQLDGGPLHLQQTVIYFTSTEKIERIMLGLGLCTAPCGRPAHWAWAQTGHNSSRMEGDRRGEHDCARDHIDTWGPRRTRDFVGDEGRVVRLTFRPCPHTPATTRLVHIELGGPAYEEMQRIAGVVDSPLILSSSELSAPAPLDGPSPPARWGLSGVQRASGGPGGLARDAPDHGRASLQRPAPPPQRDYAPRRSPETLVSPTINYHAVTYQPGSGGDLVPTYVPQDAGVPAYINSVGSSSSLPGGFYRYPSSPPGLGPGGPQASAPVYNGRSTPSYPP